MYTNCIWIMKFKGREVLEKLAFSTARMCARIPLYVDTYVYRGLDCVTVLTGAR